MFQAECRQEKLVRLLEQAQTDRLKNLDKKCMPFKAVFIWLLIMESENKFVPSLHKINRDKTHKPLKYFIPLYLHGYKGQKGDNFSWKDDREELICRLHLYSTSIQVLMSKHIFSACAISGISFCLKKVLTFESDGENFQKGHVIAGDYDCNNLCSNKVACYQSQHSGSSSLEFIINYGYTCSKRVWLPIIILLALLCLSFV